MNRGLDNSWYLGRNTQSVTACVIQLAGYQDGLIVLPAIHHSISYRKFKDRAHDVSSPNLDATTNCPDDPSPSIPGAAKAASFGSGAGLFAGRRCKTRRLFWVVSGPFEAKGSEVATRRCNYSRADGQLRCLGAT
jgi:hypothetical protein